MYVQSCITKYIVTVNLTIQCTRILSSVHLVGAKGTCIILCTSILLAVSTNNELCAQVFFFHFPSLSSVTTHLSAQLAELFGSVLLLLFPVPLLQHLPPVLEQVLLHVLCLTPARYHHCLLLSIIHFRVHGREHMMFASQTTGGTFVAFASSHCLNTNWFREWMHF